MSENNTVELRPIGERPAIAIYADYAGYVPVIGSCVGIVRAVCALAMAAFTAMKWLSCQALLRILPDDSNASHKVTQWSQSCEITAYMICAEYVRGLMEIVPFATVCYDRYKAHNELDGNISDGAYGRYIYQAPHPSEFLCYSQKSYEGTFNWQDRKFRDQIIGATIIVKA